MVAEEDSMSDLLDIQPPPDIVAGINSGDFEGLGITSEGVVSILKIDVLLYESNKILFYTKRFNLTGFLGWWEI
jgi:hypothetical protein